ncbi:MAG TPA: MFS transporter [Planctomycetota bacterium]|nr:MFS transporter [Planctomycetota bacterium]
MDFLPIAILLVVVAFVIGRLPKVEVGHSDAYRRRRALNWIPLGLTYAFLYMGRYNLNATLDAKVLDPSQYGEIFLVGAWVYGCAFLVNGPLTDRLGGRFAILTAAAGSATMNALMSLATQFGYTTNRPVLVFSVLYGINMYFQSFGAVAVIKVNSAWFHVRERGVFGGIFGILISLGNYFAFDWGRKIALGFPGHIEWLFRVPATILAGFFIISFILVRDTPSDAGHKDFDPGDASSGDTGPRPPVFTVLGRMLSNPVIMVIAFIEMCSGFMRDSMTHWFKTYATAVGPKDQFVVTNWGTLICVAGILGGTFAGIISDRLFHSRRPPVAAVLYTNMLLGALLLLALIGRPEVAGFVVMFMIMSVLGVHGVLSGTASADFGGKKNAGIATGIIDGFVYAGVGIQSALIGHFLPRKGSEAAAVVDNWRIWPELMLPAATVGLILATRVWNAKPKAHAAPAPGPASKRRRASREGHAKVLDQALEAARAAGSKGIVVFDLDSTVFDNRPRQAKILGEWASARDVTELANVQPSHFDGWDLKVAMTNCGIKPERAAELFPDAKTFWRERFFTSAYCVLDVGIPGAREFLAQVGETGAQIAYVTGRDEGMRDGTVDGMKNVGFPVPDGKSVHLIMKPTPKEEDDAWKTRATEQLRALGRVVAAFDNEPAHANIYKAAFPDAFVVHLDTDDSARPVTLAEQVPSILDFVR